MKIYIDALSNYIRQVDGNNQLGAGALAEKIAQYLLEQAPAVEPARSAAEPVYFEANDYGPGWLITDERTYNRRIELNRMKLYHQPTVPPAIVEQIRQLSSDVKGDQEFLIAYWHAIDDVLKLLEAGNE